MRGDVEDQNSVVRNEKSASCAKAAVCSNCFPFLGMFFCEPSAKRCFSRIGFFLSCLCKCLFGWQVISQLGQARGVFISKVESRIDQIKTWLPLDEKEVQFWKKAALHLFVWLKNKLDLNKRIRVRSRTMKSKRAKYFLKVFFSSLPAFFFIHLFFVFWFHRFGCESSTQSLRICHQCMALSTIVLVTGFSSPCLSLFWESVSASTLHVPHVFKPNLLYAREGNVLECELIWRNCWVHKHVVMFGICVQIKRFLANVHKC